MTVEQAKAIIASPFFNAFLDPAANRSSCITAWLSAQKVPYRTVTLQDKTHIIISYRQSAYNPRFKMKTLIAHYDRAENTPGANDNSAACVQLLRFAQLLLHTHGAHNIRIIFTDGEEAGAEGIRNQGSYRLGQGLRALAMERDDIFVFDLCGTGDTLILSESGIYGRDKKKTVSLTAFHRRCCVYAEEACSGQWMSLPTAYSDNAGLISAGLTAQVITVLPRAEAALLMHYLPRTARNGGIPHLNAHTSGDEGALHALLHCIITNAPVHPASPLAAVIPQTWQRMHTPQDSIATLTPEAFMRMDAFLRYLITVKEG